MAYAFICDYCGRSFPDPKALVAHVVAVHVPAMEQQTVGVLDALEEEIRNISIRIGTTVEETWNSLPAIIRDTFNNITFDLVPLTNSIIAKIDELIPRVNLDLQSIIRGIGDQIGIDFTRILQGITGFKNDVEALISGDLDELGTSLDDLETDIRSFIEDSIPALKQFLIDDIKRIEDELNINITSLDDGLASAITGFDTTTTNILTGLYGLLDPLEIILTRLGNWFLSEINKLFDITPESLATAQQKMEEMYLKRSKELLDQELGAE